MTSSASNLHLLEGGAAAPSSAGTNSPRIHVSSLPIAANLRIPRSPSRDSVATELSLYSVSSYQSADFWKLSPQLNLLKAVPEVAGSTPSAAGQYFSCLTPNRGPSPIPGGTRFLKVPNASSASRGGAGVTADCSWWEEETSDLNVIKSCATLSKALGLQKSFSTGDIVSLDEAELGNQQPFAAGIGKNIRPSVSEVTINHMQQYERERMAFQCGMGSRSMSTWVAVGDGGMFLQQGITSQLPSPQGRPTSVHVENPNKSDVASFSSVSFTAADLILSVNKRVRQHYIRRRLLATYKALERLSQSQYNLDRMAASASVSADQEGHYSTAATTSAEASSHNQPPSSSSQITASNEPATWMKNATLTLKDVERDRGRPLSKYQRNMMIFNWLHSLEETQSDFM